MTNTERDAFITLKEICNKACHDRNACVKGFRQMLESNNMAQMMATWRDNWEDIVGSRFADIIREKLPLQYSKLQPSMNSAGIFLNDCPFGANDSTLVIVTDCDTPVCIHGKAQAYIIGTAEVLAYDHSQVYNEKCNSIVVLHDYAYGSIFAGKAYAIGRSKLKCNCEAYVNGAVKCYAKGGIVTADNYHEIVAYGDTKIYSKSVKNIKLNDKSQIVLK